ncbi:unnamed protein product, partial [Polarella glacialis]
MAATALIHKPPDQKAEGMLHISLVGVGGDKIAEGTWHRSCKMLELFRIARRSKPRLQISLFYGLMKLNSQMSLEFLDQNLGSVLLTVCFFKAAKKEQPFGVGL